MCIRDRIRNAEIEAARLLEEGSQKSKDTIREGEVFAEKEYKRILSEAKAQAEKIKESAVEEGESIARPIIEKGIQEAKDLTNPVSYTHLDVYKRQVLALRIIAHLKMKTSRFLFSQKKAEKKSTIL